MRLILLITMFVLTCNAFSDNIATYISIANEIPKMEIQANSNSHVWAHSARKVLMVTSESIAETMLQANEIAKKSGKPLFCLPADFKLDGTAMDILIKKGAGKLTANSAEQKNISVSSVAWQVVIEEFPCGVGNKTYQKQITHVSSILNKSN